MIAEEYLQHDGHRFSLDELRQTFGEFIAQDAYRASWWLGEKKDLTFTFKIEPLEIFAPDIALLKKYLLEHDSLSLEVEILSDNLGTQRQMVEGMGFRVSGTVVKANGIFVRFNKKVRDAGDGVTGQDPNLAVPAPVLQITDVEARAVEHMKRTVSVPSDIEEQAKRIKDEAMRTFHPEIESPEFSMAQYRFLQQENDAQIALLQAEIAAMQSKPESAE